jgi:hypothetical protein
MLITLFQTQRYNNKRDGKLKEAVMAYFKVLFGTE